MMGKCQWCKKNGRENDGPYLWIRLWPFNFRHVDCPHCGPVSDEDWLWDKFFEVMHFLTPWDGTMHRRRHPWWEGSHL